MKWFSNLTMNHFSMMGYFYPLKAEGILRKFQKVMQLSQKWKDLKNNGST
jgi:hypothetical protein